MPDRPVTRLIATAVAVLAVLLAFPVAAGAVQTVKVGDFDQPIYVTSPPGDNQRLFVVEKPGRIQLIHNGARKQFLDIHDKVVDGGERGLLSMAFPRDYATSGRFYVYYTAPRTDDPDGSVITVAEYRRSAPDPDTADPGSERPVVTVDHPINSNHNGGQLQFGPDGLLYLATGDGGAGNDPPNNAQNPASRLGKMLRIDPRQAGAVPELFALGLRNPWRFSFDRANGNLVIADVGQSAREEIDLLPKGTGAGTNFGWSCREGLLVGPRTCTGAFVDPVLDYDHGGGRCAITGGYVVRHPDLSSLLGRYVYTDLCGGDVRSVVLASPRATDDSPTGITQANVFSFGEDSCGHLYMASGGGEVDVLVDGSVTPCPPPPDPPDPDPDPDPKPPPDRRAPGLTVARKFRQHLAPRRSLYLTVTCDERCAITAGVKVPVPGRSQPFRAAASLPSLRRDRPVRIRLLLSQDAARAVRDAIDDGRKVRATLRVVARDAARNQTVKTRPVRVLR
ncbi:MAG TPA: PQQ-dependent sugar dehydrogenase [Thermoleophilaceae bacterium]|nr:PQQ-dependent sugar dehydrogenase [Thermoleophilaceae bacterium]